MKNKKIPTLNFDLSESLFDLCKPDMGKNTCRFLEFCHGTPTCTRFTSEGVERNKNAETETQYEQGSGCDAGLGDILKIKSQLIGKKVQYSYENHVFNETMFVGDIIFNKHRKKLIIQIRTERDTFPFTIPSDYLCIYFLESAKYRFSSILGGHSDSGSVDILL